MSANTWWCPVCGAQCPTLQELLTCHPRELRILTDGLGRKPLSAVSLEAIVARPLSQGTRRAVWVALHPGEAEVEAA